MGFCHNSLTPEDILVFHLIAINYGDLSANWSTQVRFMLLYVADAIILLLSTYQKFLKNVKPQSDTSCVPSLVQKKQDHYLNRIISSAINFVTPSHHAYLGVCYMIQTMWPTAPIIVTLGLQTDDKNLSTQKEQR